jgi:hypothetical protein
MRDVKPCVHYAPVKFRVCWCDGETVVCALGVVVARQIFFIFFSLMPQGLADDCSQIDLQVPKVSFTVGTVESPFGGSDLASQDEC